MKKKITTQVILLMISLSYFTAIPYKLYAEEIENNIEKKDNEKETGSSKEEYQKIEEQFEVSSLKNNRQLETAKETIFETTEGNEVDLEDVRIGPLTIEEDRETRQKASVRYKKVHVPLGANKEMQEKVFKQSSILYFADEELPHEELDIFNFLMIPNSEKINLKETTLKTQEGEFDKVYVLSNQLAFSSRYTMGNFMGTIKDYQYVTNYGETIEIIYPANSTETLAFTLHEREGNKEGIHVNRPDGHFLTANSPSKGQADSSYYDNSRPNEELMIFEIYRSEQQIALGYDPVKSMSVKGNTRKSEVINFFDDSKVYSDGAILRIFAKDKNAIKKYEYNDGDKPKGPSNVSGYNSDDNIFFNINKGKFTKASSTIKISPAKKLEVNAKRKIGRGASQEYMEATIADFFINNADFDITADDMSYVSKPETNKLGKQTTDITVLEYDEKTNKTWKQTYVVPYEVVADSGPQMLTKSRDVKLGTTKDELDTSIENSFEEVSLNNIEYDDMEFVKYPDTNMVGNQTGKIKVINEKSEQGNLVDRIYDVEFNVFEPTIVLTVETQEVELSLGTDVSTINPNNYVSVVYCDGEKLESNEYTTKFLKKPNTNRVGNNEVEVEVTLNEDETISSSELVNGKVLWGHSIGSSLDGTKNTPMDVSVSMLHNKATPYLVANEGNGLAEGASSLSSINIYRETEDKDGEIFHSRQYYPYGQARETMDLWNNGGTWWGGNTQLKGFKDTEFHYGDVVAYEAQNAENPGMKTWASREEKLIKESVGYQKVYYEMTKDGFHLLQLNRLKVNENIPVVSMNTTIEEMNKKAKDAMIIPTGNTGEYTFEYESVDTKTSGIKKSKMNVYEKLQTGGTFKTTYEVTYQVNPQAKENFYDEAGKEIKSSKITNFDLGKTYQPEADKFVSFGDEVYMYKGWLKADEKPGKDKIRNGNPDKMTKEDTVHYIYEKSEKYINVTIPTEMIFGTENGKDVTSVDYEIKNDSSKVKTEISLNEFKKESSEVKLLTKKEKDPTKTAQSARLNLTTNGETAIDSLSDTTKNETITTLKPGEKATMGVSGKYFGKQDQSARIKYNMMLKFKVVPD